MNVEWPSLSFDIVRDPWGALRSKFPMEMLVVAGTQADRPQNNKLYLMKWSDLHKTKHDREDESDEDEDDGSDSEESEDETDDDPVVEEKSVKHFGGVNRVRVCLAPYLFSSSES